MRMNFASVAIFLTTMWGSCHSETPLNILIGVSISSRSHVKGLMEISKVLTDRGHRIHYASPPRYLKYTEGYNLTLHELPAIPETLGSGLYYLFKRQKVGRGLASLDFSQDDLEIYYKDHKIMFQSMTKLITEQQFDVIICDFYSIGCKDAVNHLKMPLIISMQTIHAIGLYDVPYLSYDEEGGPISLEKMSFFERLYDFTITWYKNRKLQSYHLNAINKSRKELGVELDPNPMGPMDKNLALSVSFFGFELPVHTSPNLKLVGPIRSSQPNPLTEDLKVFLEIRTNVVYIGFGTLSSVLPEDFRDILLGMTMLLDDGVIDGVIWCLDKYEWDQPIHPSIKILNWTPQSAILDHPSTKLFISHSGIESVFDSIFSGTPIMSFPQFGDQQVNGAKVEHIGIGKVYPRLGSTPSKLADFAKSILTDPDKTIQVNVNRLQKLAELRSRHGPTDGANIIEDYAYLSQTCRPHFSSSSSTPCDLLHLLPASVSMGTTRAFNYDIYIFLSSFFTLLLISISYLLYRFITRINIITKKKVE